MVADFRVFVLGGGRGGFWPLVGVGVRICACLGCLWVFRFGGFLLTDMLCFPF